MSPLARSQRPWILICVGLVLAGGSIAILIYLSNPLLPLMVEKSHCEDLIQTALRRDRPGFEAIVKAVHKQGLAGDQSTSFSFPKGGSPDSMQKVDMRFDRMSLGEFCEKNTLVHAYRRGGILFVKVVMCELGHAGTYAVMYSSKELTEEEIGHQLVPHALERLDPHWWAVIEWY